MIQITDKTLAQLIDVFNAANTLIGNEYAAAACVDDSPAGAEDEICEQWNQLLESLEENADDIEAFIQNFVGECA